MQHIRDILDSPEFKKFQALKAQCESPIEEKMLSFLIAFDFEPELQVNIGPYRVDFLLKNIIIIECDGKDYHNDLVRERNRDDYLKDAGYTVVHFTGAEIYWEIRKCMVFLISNFFKEKTDHPLFLAYTQWNGEKEESEESDEFNEDEYAE